MSVYDLDRSHAINDETKTYDGIKKQKTNEATKPNQAENKLSGARQITLDRLGMYQNMNTVMWCSAITPVFWYLSPTYHEYTSTRVPRPFTL